MATILLIEDNAMNRDMLTRRLVWEGYQVISAPDGERGIRLAQSARPDLILMDMNLPVMDGWQATLQLKAAAYTHDIPIIALTAHALTEERERCMAVGCDDYELKPIEFARLLAKMRALLSGAADDD